MKEFLPNGGRQVGIEKELRRSGVGELWEVQDPVATETLLVRGGWAEIPKICEQWDDLLFAQLP